MNNKLLNLFRPKGEFRRGDIVELSVVETKPQWIFLKHDKKRKECHVWNERNGYREFDLEDLTLIEPMVTLPEVLMKLNEKNSKVKSEWNRCHYSLYLFEEYFGIDAKKYKKEDGSCEKLISIKWILQKDGIDLNLWKQSEKTKKSIADILG